MRLYTTMDQPLKTEASYTDPAMRAVEKSSKLKTSLQLFFRDYLYIVVINTICAVVVTYVMQVHASFWGNWVFSMCIGTTATLLIDGVRLVIWGSAQPKRLVLVGLTFIAVPVAYFVGSYVAILILNMPMNDVWNEQVNHSTPMLTFIAVVCLVASWIFWSRSEMLALKAQAETEKARSAGVERQAMQAQLQLLQAQIEPHMLFNTLANLQGLIGIDPVRAQHMLDQLILYLRATLSSARADKTSLIHEFDLMRAFLELMSVRMGTRLSYSLELPQDLHNVTIPPMLLQPLVENAIKHGLESKIEGGHINVTATREGESLILSVADTGLGLEATNHAHYLKHGTQVGLANVRERLHALYGDKAEFKLIPNTPAGAIAQLSIPLSL